MEEVSGTQEFAYNQRVLNLFDDDSNRQWITNYFKAS